MADTDRSSSATPWLAFLVGVVIAALVVAGFIAYGGARAPQRTAELTINTPQINPPDVNPPELPKLNPPSVPAPTGAAAPAPSP